MKHTKPLKELIEELQALESANPGIFCMVNDHEHGGDVPKVELSKFYINKDNHVIILNDNNIKSNKKIMKLYEQSAEKMWESFGDDKGMWESFEKFKADHKTTKEFYKNEMKEMATSIPVIVIHT